MRPKGLSAEKVIDVDHVIATAPWIMEDDIIGQFQTHQAESDKDGNDCDDKTVNNVAPEWPSRLSEAQKWPSLPLIFSKMLPCTAQQRWNAESFFKIENLFSRERLSASKQTNITEFFDEVV